MIRRKINLDGRKETEDGRKEKGDRRKETGRREEALQPTALSLKISEKLFLFKF